MSNQYYTPEEENFLKEFYELNGSKFCAKHLNKTALSILNKAHDMNLKANLSSIFQKLRSKPNNEFNVNADIFIQPTSLEVCYILGLIWADGHVSKNRCYSITLSCQREDGNVFESIFVKTGKWRIYKYKKAQETWQDQTIFTTTNKPLSLFLESMDYKIKSFSNQEKILSVIPKNLHYMFWRGYFDGDGCIYLREKDKLGQICLVSSYDQDWSSLSKLLTDKKINFTISRIISKKNHQSSRLIITKAAHIIEFFNFIYPNGFDEIGLSRKYKKFESLVLWEKERTDKEANLVSFIQENIFKIQKQDICSQLNISKPKLFRILKQYNIPSPPKGFLRRYAIIKIH